MVGPNAAHKNIAPVARALAGRGIRVVVVGGAGADGVFRSEAASCRVIETGPGRIQRVGRVSDETITWLYRHAAVLVFPSLYEGFGLPVVEAQRLGCPVVASDRASLPEMAGESALLVDPTHPDQVAQRVAELLADRPGWPTWPTRGAPTPSGSAGTSVPLGWRRRSASSCDPVRASGRR